MKIYHIFDINRIYQKGWKKQDKGSQVKEKINIVWFEKVPIMNCNFLENFYKNNQ